MLVVRDELPNMKGNATSPGVGAVSASGKTPQPALVDKSSGKLKVSSAERQSGKQHVNERSGNLRVEGSQKLPIGSDTEPQHRIGQSIIERSQPRGRWMIITAIVLFVLAATAAGLYYGGVVKI
jgi:hypothetical protein